MINFFPMIPAANQGAQVSGDTIAAGNSTGSSNSLFAAILQKANGSSENVSTMKGLALLMNSAAADTATSNDGSGTTGITTNINLGNKTSKSLIQSQDLMLPASAASLLISFLKTKGFSTDQIDKMMISSTNNEGMVQVDKLVAAMTSTINASGSGANTHQASGTGLIIDESSIPKVQEMLFKMGLGVGEVKSTIEKSVNQDGTLSLDKLASSLESVSTGNFSKTELASMLAQNNVEIKPQSSDMNSTVTALNQEPVINTQVNDIKKTVSDFKKEFRNFVHVSSQDNAGQKDAALSRIKAQTQEITSVNNTTTGSGIDASDISKAFAAATEPENSQSSNQHLSKGQTKWQKSVEGKIINILSNKDKSTATENENGPVQLKSDVIPAFKDAFKQGDQNLKQEIISAVAADKSGSETHVAAVIKDLQNEKDINAGITDIKDAPLAGLTQNITKTTEVTEIKSQLKTAYNLPEPLPKVFDKMVVMIKNGEQSGKLIIQPPELGKIDINLTIRDGHIQANLSAENYAVKEIIETNLNQLKQQLSDQGLIVEQFSVSVGSQHRQFDGDNGQAWNGGSGSSSSDLSDINDVSSIVDNVSGIYNGQYRVDVHV